jgi:hypothetical protein
LFSRSSALWVAAFPAVALALALLRWIVQGGGTVYTSTAKTLYVADPDLGWRATDGGPIWLGLDAIAAIAAASLALLAAAWLMRRYERRTGRVCARVRVALMAVGGATLALPIAAWATGMGPAGAHTSLPRELAQAPEPGVVEGAIEGLPAGSYRIVDHRETNLVASLKAGGEAFEARWDSGLRGHLRIDPGDLAQPMSADISADADEVATGIGMRDRHTREYLQAGEHAELRFELRALDAAAPQGDGVAYSARGEIELLGRRHPVDIAGVLRPISDDARARLDLPEGQILLATAELEIDLADTALADHEDDFDESTVPVRVSLVLRHEARHPGTD